MIGGAVAVSTLAEALHAYYPVEPVDPDDITTWPAPALDELALWDLALRGDVVVDEVPEAHVDHGVTRLGDHTIGGA